jgi:hypothetical protein
MFRTWWIIIAMLMSVLMVEGGRDLVEPVIVIVSEMLDAITSFKGTYLHLLDPSFQLTGHFCRSLPILCRLG